MVILRRRDFFKRLVREAAKNIRALWLAYRDLNGNDIVYINTIIGVDFIIMARFSRRAVVIHVREIPVGFEAKVFRRLLLWSRATLIFNSEATRRAFDLPPRVKAHVVHNAVEDGAGAGAPTRPHGQHPLRILTIGRLNHWKGQEILIDAVARLGERAGELCVRIVGGTFNNQDDFRQSLFDRIEAAGLADRISIEPFTADPSEHYRWADLVVVPSRLPEPFGRVAAEAMTYGRPVIASRHGGLVEIVADGETGLLFAPGDPDDLARAITTFLDDPARVVAFGCAGRARFETHFSLPTFDKAFAGAMREVAR